jgi:hypothetical protein
MLFKTATSLAFATACFTAAATLPASAQMAGAAAGQGYQAGPGYQTPPTAAPPTRGPNWPQGGYGATTGDTAAQPNPGSMPYSSAGNDVISNTPQGATPPNWSAQQNVRQSERYDRLLESNRGFREARIRRECGPITDPDLHQQCLSSFNQDEPYTGSSTSHRSYRSESGQ